MRRALLALALLLLGGAAYAQLMMTGVGGNGGSASVGNLLQENGNLLLQENSSKIQVQQ